MKKTLGGDRLGAGKKMQVELKNFERSTFDLSYLWRSTMAAGTLVPFMNQLALAGDTFDIVLDAMAMTHPTIGPLFGTAKVQLDVFQIPLRLYNSLTHNNELGIGRDISQVKFPVINIAAKPIDATTSIDFDNSQINPSCLLSYLGIRGVGSTTDVGGTARTFNAIPLLAYWEIYKNYFSFKPGEIGAFLHTPATGPATITLVAVEQGGSGTIEGIPAYPAIGNIFISDSNDTIRVTYTGTPIPNPEEIIFETTLGELTFEELTTTTLNDTSSIYGPYDAVAYGGIQIKNWRQRSADESWKGKPAIDIFPLSNIDDMRKAILAYSSKTTPFDIYTPDLSPYKYLVEEANGIPNILASQEGLALKTYQSDLFNNWLNTEWIDGTGGISDVTAVDTSGGSFKIDALIMAKKVHEMLNQIAVSGGSYDDWLDAVYMHPRYRQIESPMYCGGLSKEIIFQEVVNNSKSVGEPLGTLAGRGVMGDKHKGGKIVIKCDEPSIIMGIVSITPRLDYCQGNDFIVNLESMDDLHKPHLGQIGFQELITEQMAWWSTEWDGTKWVQKSAGKQPAWLNYQTNINKVFGNFAIRDDQGWMVFTRRYEKAPTTFDIMDLTTYVDPSKFNHVFAHKSLDAQNYWMQLSVNITARRKMTSRVMPHL